MTMTVETRPVGAESARRRISRAERLKSAWRNGECPDALAALANDPELAADRPLALEVAYEEFCTRIEAGKTVDPDAFCSRFPFAASLRRLVDLYHFLDEHPQVLDAVPSEWPVPGDVLGDFLLVRRLGQGGFARVYLALETTTGDRPVVLKVAQGHTHEAKTLGPLSHPHLIAVLSSPTIDRWRIVAMPFVGTATLEEVIAAAWPAGRTPPRSAQTILDAAASVSHLDDPPFTTSHTYAISPKMTYERGIEAIAASLFSALAFLHERGIAHRDVKPTNVLLTPSGHPYLLDFNLATNPLDYWREVGTLPYMAPEQVRLVADADAVRPDDWRRCDIFSCGVLLYELLTGRHPFGDFRHGGCGKEEQKKHARALQEAQQAGHSPLARLNRCVSRELASAVERCLSRDPKKRPTAGELARLLTPQQRSRQLWRQAAPALLAGSLPVVGLCAYLARPAPPEAQVRELLTEPVAPVSAPGSIGPHERANLLLEQGEHGLAAREYLKIGKEHGDGKAFALAAYCLSLTGSDHLGAITAAEEAIQHGFQPAAVYANRAYNYLRRNRLREAKTDCDSALKLEPDLRAARFTRAATYQKIATGQHNCAPPQEAIDDISFVVADGTNNKNVWNVAATLYTLASSGSPQLQERAAQCIHEAILCGTPPYMFSHNPLFLTRLSGHPIFEDALKLARGRPDNSENYHVVNPTTAR